MQQLLNHKISAKTHQKRPSPFPQNKTHTLQVCACWAPPVRKQCRLQNWWLPAVWGTCTWGCSNWNRKNAISNAYSSLWGWKEELTLCQDKESARGSWVTRDRAPSRDRLGSLPCGGRFGRRAERTEASQLPDNWNKRRTEVRTGSKGSPISNFKAMDKRAKPP